MTAPGRRGSGRGGGPAIPNTVRGAVLVFLAVIVGIIGLQILDDSQDGASVTISTSDTSAPATTIAGQGPKAHLPGEVTLKVYNASDIQGAGQQLSDKLKTFGYKMETPANLNTTQKGTVVQCRAGYEPDGTVVAVYGIGNGATTAAFPSSPPEGADKANCIVILGTK